MYNTDERIREAHRIIEKYQAQLTQAAPPNSKYHLDKLLEGISGSQTPTFELTAQEMENADREAQREFTIALAEREHYYCAISGSFDRERDKLLDTHIIPLYLNSFDETWDDTGRTTIRNAACTWDILQSWTQFDLGGLRGDKITSPSNGIYMTSDDHNSFGAFKFYLDMETFPNEDNKSRAVCLGGRLSNGIHSSVVIFNNLEPPNADYLMIHAAFARVLHLCGAAEYMEDIRRDAERVDMRYSDGQTDFGQALPSR
ncbi:hypothetical protein K438DRAFT_2030775 [Mycena galopus ATCC 62051]|nr:hypothetical protein K438DRAFT_2030775 [Mycena galopus ATCC 62051]